MTNDYRSELKKMDIQTLVGRAIAYWSILEAELADVLRCCIWPTINLKTGTFEVYGTDESTSLLYSTTSFRSKLFMVDAIMRSIFEGHKANEPLSHWSKIKERLERLSKSRDKIAHWIPMHLDNSGEMLCHPKIFADPLIRGKELVRSSNDIITAIGSYMEVRIEILDLVISLKNSHIIRDRFIRQSMSILADHDIFKMASLVMNNKN